jgi:hypothetical protein
LGLLLFRSFCEVIIAGEAHRNTFDEAKFEKNHSARCALYGVISVPLVLVLANAMGVSKNDVIQDSKDQVAREVRSKLKQQLNSVTDNQVKTAPALAPILENMLIPIQNPNQGASNDNEIRRRAEVRFIRRLMGRYAGWKPIFKQDSQL